MKHAAQEPRRLGRTIALALLLGALVVGVFLAPHVPAWLAHKGVDVHWSNGKRLGPPPTAHCSSGWLWKPSANQWICTKP